MLNKLALFSYLNKSEISHIEQCANIHSYPRNTILISEGDDTNSIYVIMNGAVKVFLSDANGKEIVINYQKTGEYFGELALLNEEARCASVMTTEFSTFLVIPKSVFLKVLHENTDMAITLIKDLSNRIRLLTDNVKSLALLDVYGRIAKTLLNLAIPQEGKMVIIEKLTKQDLASRVGASREMVSRIMKDLDSGGYISYQKNYIVINNQLPQHY